jgi:hypothetical protein
MISYYNNEYTHKGKMCCSRTLMENKSGSKIYLVKLKLRDSTSLNWELSD